MDTTARLSLALLGSFEVTLDNQPVTTFESVKVRALLAYLAVEAGRSHTRAFLAELLWPDLPAATALTYLRHVLAKLKEAIPDGVPDRPPFLLVTRETIALNPAGDYQLDIASFTALLEESAGHPHRHPETCRACAWRREAAVALYRGDFLEHFLLGDSAAFEEWAALKRERLRQQLLDTLTRLITYDERRGAYPQAQRFARRQVEIDPWDDEACRQLMRVLWLSGQRSAALDQYAHVRRILQQELGIEPSAETTMLYEHIRTAATSTPPDGTPSPPAHNLPAPTTPLVGREAELTQLADLLQQPTYRLITLSGAGGIGKTRIALHAAAELLDDFADGVCLVTLAPVTDPALVIPTIAQALGVQESSAQPLLKSLTIHLHARQLLLVLDNFEQVIVAATMVANLLAACPRLTILVTSREILHLYGEHEFPVPPLSLPDVRRLPALPDLNQYEAVRLFVERARAVHSDFAVTDETAPAIAEICHRLDGLPLAIELAAARIKLLTPQALLARLGDRLKLLTGGARDLPARQQTLRRTIDWSYNLLDVSEQLLFQRLSVFVGGCSLAAIAAVQSSKFKVLNDDQPNSKLRTQNSELDILDGLTALIDKSLLRREAGADGEPRFVMLETIHAYALERLVASGEQAALRQRHALYYLSLAERAEPLLHSAEQRAWLDLLEADHDNLRAALAWSQASADCAAVGLRLAAALWPFWRLGGHMSEGREQLTQMLAYADVSAPTVAHVRALFALGFLAGAQGEFTLANARLTESHTLSRTLGYQQGIAYARYGQGFVAWLQGELSTARACQTESLAIFRELSQRWPVAVTAHALGDLEVHMGAYERGEPLLEESLQLFRALGDQLMYGHALLSLGYAARLQGHNARATTYYAESLALFHNQKNAWGIAAIHLSLGDQAQAQGDAPQAAAYFAESLARYHEIGHREGILLCLAGLAWAAGGLGQPVRAARLFGAVASLRASFGISESGSPAERRLYEASMASVRAQLDQAAFAAAWAEGRTLTMEQAIAEALA